MDFNIIESLSNEEISELYEEDTLQKKDFYITHCPCFVGNVSIYGYVNFGSLGYDNNYNHIAPHAYGYCELQLLYVNDCASLCRRMNTYYIYFNDHCYCRSTQSASTWSQCKR